MITLSIPNDFSRTPGARTREEGKFSGEEFREDILLPLLKKAISENNTLVVDLDGSAGYSSGFLEEAFGGLIRIDGIENSILESTIKIKSDEDKSYMEDIRTYLKNANNGLTR